MGFAFQTTADSFHIHWFDPSDSFTEPPAGLDTGHRHEIKRDDNGIVVGFAKAEDHKHSIRENDIEFLAQHDKKRKKDFSQVNEIRGVEIFRTGEWNNEKYSAADLDSMVSAFSEVGFKPPIKLGHAEKSGDPAYGWVTRIYREGEVLLADFSDIADNIFELIKKKAYDAVSSEIFFDIKRNGKKFSRALKAVALLGAEIPAVADLSPLSESITSLAEGEFAKVSIHSLKKDDLMSDDNKTELEKQLAASKAETEAANARADTAEKTAEEFKAASENTGSTALDVKRLQEEVVDLRKENEETKATQQSETIAAKVKDFCIPALREHVDALYQLAYQSDQTVTFTIEGSESKLNPVAVVDDILKRLDAHSAKLFKEIGHTGGLDRDDAPASDNPGVEIDALAKKHAAKNNVEYDVAMKAVMDDPKNAELVTAYNES